MRALAKALERLQGTVVELSELVHSAYQGDCEAQERLAELLDQNDTEMVPKSKTLK